MPKNCLYHKKILAKTLFLFRPKKFAPCKKMTAKKRLGKKILAKKMFNQKNNFMLNLENKQTNNKFKD